MNILFFLTGLLLVFILGYLASYNRKGIRVRPIVAMLLTQIVLAFLLLNTRAGVVLVSYVAKLFAKLVEIGIQGVDFVFGGLENEGISNFFLDVLLPIIFISVLIGILNHLKILPLIIKYVGLVISKINGMGRLENYIAVSSAILGQSEVFLTAKRELNFISKRRLYTLCTSAMSAVSIAIVGAYMTMLEPRYVVVAIVLNILSALIIANIINPYRTEDEDNVQLIEAAEEKEKKLTFFQMISESIMDGLKIAIIVAAMLIGFIALINLINYIFTLVFHISFQDVLGYIFAPIAFLMGVPANEAVRAGSIMATKLVTNEFVAMLSFKDIAGQLSERTVGIVSVFLVSFANFSSVGIITGAVRALHEEKGDEVATFGMKLLYGSTLASILSGTIIGLFL
ncbi:NupC/NupG family nucleoside CNT transporter [Aneurinibacillus migulanus]|uniref:Nucleoside transport protein n=1 Tax=Aneurinibacillus migulanus TaxID=47500 RepID=A0A0D1Y113_ANEMI|nr:nucleoside transporter C-terminal domain-containing protein [Aneurinibacillus migulanus]KIV60196.1 pyrimidine nucleoside transporter NupC [Aneurinibacillus migulanus]KON97256.1 pyrimidine nucleoside transporter NupC [Aneurinibacillus migulanus]MED0895868.1 nucleoside transporter C-terminal domain-containing protein [Aneurinibacillus migulanus]MED1618845.1 nucleoside transporter C-terminal domain-containing protein [Aneurinibacillus migulanus]SDJ54157.1 nucleoside transport protein [Aneurini